MALPNAVQVVLLTVGNAFGALGTEASISGTVRPVFGGNVSSILWQATNGVYHDVDESVVSGVTGEASCSVPYPHQAGWVVPVIGEGGVTQYQAITDWGYYFDGILSFNGQTRLIQKSFKVPPGATGLDIDTVASGQVVSGVQGPYVPIAGAMTLDELTDVDTTGAVTGQVLKRNSGGQWVPATDSGGTPDDGSVSNVKVASAAGITLDKTADSAAGGGRLAMTSAERTKLSGVAAGATANATDAALRDRSTHTGTQDAATSLANLTEVVQDIVGAFIVAGANTTVSYNDAANTLTINAATGTVTDPEVVRDVIGAAMVAGAGIQIVYDDALDTLTISSTAVLPTRTITAGTGLSGGGDLSANRTLSVNTATESSPGILEIATTAEATAGTDTVRAVTPAGLKAAVDALVSGAPGALDTLSELAAALGNDASFAATITNALAARVRADTASQGLDSVQQSNARANIGALPIMPAANVGADYSIPYVSAAALETRPTLPSGAVLRIWGGTVADTDPAWMVDGDYRDIPVAG